MKRVYLTLTFMALFAVCGIIFPSYFWIIPVSIFGLLACFILTKHPKEVEQYNFNLPENGQRIRILWLPNPVNNPSEKSCYIGSEGIVEDGNKTEGYFWLNTGGSSILISRGCKYEKI